MLRASIPPPPATPPACNDVEVALNDHLGGVFEVGRVRLARDAPPPPSLHLARDGDDGFLGTGAANHGTPPRYHTGGLNRPVWALGEWGPIRPIFFVDLVFLMFNVSSGNC